MQFEELMKYIWSWLYTAFAMWAEYFIIASVCFLILFVWMKKKYWFANIQQRYPNNKQIKFEIYYSSLFFLINAAFATAVYWFSVHDYTRIYTMHANKYGWTYFFLSHILVLLLHDCYYYWAHRALHWGPLFKYIHKTHHISVNPTPFATFSFHPLETCVHAMFMPLVVLFIPLHISAIVFFLTYMFFINVGGHLGHEIFPKWFLKNKITKWSNTSTHHNLHHTNVKTNFGLYFNFWDTWMKTNAKNYEEVFEKVADRRDAAKAARKQTQAGYVQPAIGTTEAVAE